MGDKATRDFILRHVFSIAGELINNPVDLLRCLLRLHYQSIELPPSLSDRLIQVLRQKKEFDSWPLEDVVPDEKAFFAFLQERWPIFLERITGKKGKIGEGSTEYGRKYPGPDDLPFDHHDIRVYVDNLFVEGKLTPVKEPPVPLPESAWARCGVAVDPHDGEEIRIQRLLKLVEESLPAGDSRYSDWLLLAAKWAELSSAVHGGSKQVDSLQFDALAKNVNGRFEAWLTTHYSSLINLPPTKPVMVHHLPRYLAREFDGKMDTRVALIILDGLSLAQWVSVRQILRDQKANLTLRESAVFAWIPTLTSVSRQAIFAGKPPLYFPGSIHTTEKENHLWRQFWEDVGMSRLEIAFRKGMGDGEVTDVLDATFNPQTTKAVGLVVDKVDQIMHGMQLGASGMHDQVKLWTRTGYLAGLLEYLLDHGYQVWLTSDHGNIECEGKGRPSEGVIGKTRGERARVYPTEELRQSVARNHDFGRKWNPIGLPPGYFPLVAGGADAFVRKGETVVSHGGISIEEVIVPLVKVERSGH